MLTSVDKTKLCLLLSWAARTPEPSKQSRKLAPHAQESKEIPWWTGSSLLGDFFQIKMKGHDEMKRQEQNCAIDAVYHG